MIPLDERPGMNRPLMMWHFHNAVYRGVASFEYLTQQGKSCRVGRVYGL